MYIVYDKEIDDNTISLYHPIYHLLRTMVHRGSGDSPTMMIRWTIINNNNNNYDDGRRRTSQQGSRGYYPWKLLFGNTGDFHILQVHNIYL